MRKQKLFAAITLSFTLAMSSVAYAVPSAEETQVQIEEKGPGQNLTAGEESQAPSESQTEAAGETEQTDSQAQTGTSSAAVSETAARPEIQSEGAVLLDASTGIVLYGKNENTQFYPASITKLMTGLLVVENCSLDDKVTFSKAATTNLEQGSVTLNLTEGDVLSVKDCLYALLLKSANEVANGLAEKVSGSVSAFADRMNARALELGCKNTHFVNPNGLNDEQHYTTPYDMALIARAAFANETLRTIDTTTSYKIPATKKVSEERTITMGHKMFYTTDSRYYPGIIGGKTGYTSKAGNTLVTGAERNGVRLIAVIMKSKGTHYQDTKALLDYGFANRESLIASGGQTVTEGQGLQNTGESQESQKVQPGDSIAETSSNTKVSGWGQDGDKKYYIKEDGKRAAGEWLKLEDKEYWFDTDGTMATGWRNFTNGDWYYFGEDGVMVSNQWAEYNGKWFYLGSTGAMLKNTTTPDGRQVDETGARK